MRDPGARTFGSNEQLSRAPKRIEDPLYNAKSSSLVKVQPMGSVTANVTAAPSLSQSVTSWKGMPDNRKRIASNIVTPLGIA